MSRVLSSSVDVHAHLAAPSTYITAPSNANLGNFHSQARAALQQLLNLPQLGSVTVEPTDDDGAAEREVRACAMDGAGDALIAEMRRRHENPRNNEATAGFLNWSIPNALRMYRRIFLAHRLVTKSRCDYAAVLRTRPDITWRTTFDWHASVSALPSPESVHIIALPGLALRRSAIPPKLLCWVDDQVAVGRLAGMGMYSSVYADFDAVGFATSILVHRADAWSHYSERMLTAHLHWCGAKVTTMNRTFPRRADPMYSLNADRLNYMYRRTPVRAQ